MDPIRLIILFSMMLCVAGCNQAAPELDKVLQQYGFSRGVPPTNLYGPGSLVYRSNYDPSDHKNSSVRLGYLCRPEYSVDRYGPRPLESASESSAVSSRLAGSFEVGAPALSKILDLNINTKAVRSAIVTVSDVKVFVYARDDLVRIRGLLGPECQLLVKKNITSQNAFQVEQAMQATVNLKITFETNASAAAKANVLKNLASFGVTGEASNTAELQGKALFYGFLLYPVDALQ